MQNIKLVLHLDPFQKLRVKIIRNGLELSPFSADLPHFLRPLARHIISYDSVETVLRAYLLANQNKIPICIDPVLDRQVYWDKSFILDRRIALNMFDDEVQLTCVAAKYDMPINTIQLLGDEFIYDSNQNKLGQLVRSTHWEGWHKLMSHITDDLQYTLPNLKGPLFNERVTIPREIFNRITLNLNMSDWIITKENKRNSVEVIESSKINYYLSIINDNITNYITCNFLGEVRGVVFTPDMTLFKKYFQNDLNSTVQIQDVPRERLITAPGESVYIQIDPEKELEMYRIINQLYQAYLEVDKKSPAVKIYQKHFINKMPELIEMLNLAGIDLKYLDKRVEVVDMDIKIKVQTKGHWFELHPEIQVNNQVLNYTLQELIKYKASLKENGMIEHKGHIEILPQKTQSKLDSYISEIERLSQLTNRMTENIKVSRPILLDWLFLKKKGVVLDLPKEDQDILESLQHFSELPNYNVPKKLAKISRPYQKACYNWLAFLYTHRFGACLADDMGLGKTLQAIMLLAGIKEKLIPSSIPNVPKQHLIVVPASLLFNWKQELNRFYPKLNVYEYSGKSRKTEWKKIDIILTTYDLLRQDEEIFKEKSFHIIIFDEAQAIKNKTAMRTQAAKKVKGQFILCLTGTPLENHIGEYCNILNIAIPDLFMPGEMRYILSKKIGYNRIINRSKPFVLRRTKSEVLSELPSKNEHVTYLTLTKDQKEIYSSIVKDVKAQINEAYDTYQPNKASIIALSAILRLRQICLSPKMVLPDYEHASPKVLHLLETLNALQAEDNSALIFSQFTQFLDIIEAALIESGIPYLRMDGKTPTQSRKKIVETFQKTKTPLFFLLSLKVGGVGLNLTKASYVFHMDPWWTPSVENQATDRTHRIGQFKKVTVNRLVMHHTIEERIMALKKEKEKIFNDVLNKGVSRNKAAILTRKDFDYILT